MVNLPLLPGKAPKLSGKEYSALSGLPRDGRDAHYRGTGQGALDAPTIQLLWKLGQDGLANVTGIKKQGGVVVANEWVHVALSDVGRRGLDDKGNKQAALEDALRAATATTPGAQFLADAPA